MQQPLAQFCVKRAQTRGVFQRGLYHLPGRSQRAQVGAQRVIFVNSGSGMSCRSGQPDIKRTVRLAQGINRQPIRQAQHLSIE